jgi:ubiquinone/menaquinone biosynthesis C-methylase UbiE
MPIDALRWNRIRYTLIAPVYDTLVRVGAHRRRAAALLDLKPGERVLVDGCGTGADLAHLPAGVEVTATDLTPAMVERTRRFAAKLARSVDARVMDAQALDLPDASFDAVLLHLILAVVPDPQAALREAERVLRPGGRATVLDKWVPEGERPSLPRRAANRVARIVATDITRQLGPLVDRTSLRVEHRETLGMGFFSLTVLRKPR